MDRMTTYTITMIETNKGVGELFYGKTDNVYHVIEGSDSNIFTVIQTKHFVNEEEFLSCLDATREDFTGCEILQDAEFSDCDKFIEDFNIEVEKKVIIYDINKKVRSVLNEWFHAKDSEKHNIIKDADGKYYYTKGVSLFNPEVVYLTEEEVKESYRHSYLQIKYNELEKDRSNWIVREVLSEEAFTARCNWLNNNGKLIVESFGY